MANLVRTSKAASDWCTADLQSYNIHLDNDNNVHTFFNQDLRHPLEPVSMVETTEAIWDLAHRPKSHEAITDTFALDWLHWHDLNYVCTNLEPEFQCMVLLKPENTIQMGGELRSAIPDFAVQERSSGATLLVGEDKRAQVEGGGDRDRIAPQLIAETIGAFTHNNEIRRNRGQEPLLSMVIPGIGIAGGVTRFYKTCVTQSLATAVNQTAYPTQPTIVARYTPSNDPLDITTCCAAFKGIVRSLAEQLRED